jgi:hypothetical protein
MNGESMILMTSHRSPVQILGRFVSTGRALVPTLHYGITHMVPSTVPQFQQPISFNEFGTIFVIYLAIFVIRIGTI